MYFGAVMKTEFIKKLSSETVFFKNEFENAFIKSVPGKGYFVKLPGNVQYPGNPESELINDAILQGVEITRAEYEKGPTV